MSEQKPDHYIDQLMDASEQEEIRTCEDVYNNHGVKLIASGTKIDRSVYQKLVKNKLLKPIDACLEINNGVDNQSIVSSFMQLAENEPIVAVFMQGLEDQEVVKKTLQSVTILPALSVKLTVTRDQAPEKFNHLIYVALASIYLGVCESLDREQLINLASAGLFHDLGEMHLDPQLVERSATLTPELRRQIYSHPIIISLILKEFSEYGPDIERAVMEHHERLDGSGYPRGLSGDQISYLGRILAAAELGVVMMEKAQLGEHWDYLSTSIKLNEGKYDAGLINHLLRLFKNQQDQRQESVSVEKTRTLWSKVNRLMTGTQQIRADETFEAGQFIHQHVRTLQQELSRSGLQIEDIHAFIDELEDASPELIELYSMAEESLFRISEIGHQVERRWPQIAGQEATIDSWLGQLRDISV